MDQSPHDQQHYYLAAPWRLPQWGRGPSQSESLYQDDTLGLVYCGHVEDDESRLDAVNEENTINIMMYDLAGDDALECG